MGQRENICGSYGDESLLYLSLLGFPLALLHFQSLSVSMGFQGFLPMQIPSVPSLLWGLAQNSTTWGDFALLSWSLHLYLFNCCLAERETCPDNQQRVCWIHWVLQGWRESWERWLDRKIWVWTLSAWFGVKNSGLGFPCCQVLFF